MEIRKCDDNDLNLLAKFNKQLIEDENSDNSMNIKQLEERMKVFIKGDYNAYFFLVNEVVVGYALINHTLSPLYLRQFHIEREHRKKGYGKKAFHLLKETLNVQAMDIEVFTWNEEGRAFWESCGFKERSIYMRFNEQE